MYHGYSSSVIKMFYEKGNGTDSRCSAESGAPCVVKQVEAFAKTSKKDILIAWVSTTSPRV